VGWSKKLSGSKQSKTNEKGDLFFITQILKKIIYEFKK
tara:strand:- start:331 stop:444 length:114 start_codon:yes stop_codon:yes gene_type:complete